MSQKQAYCTVCDHGVVPGVACDGQPKECPYHATHAVKQRQMGSFATTVDSMTGNKSVDAVRSID